MSGVSPPPTEWPVLQDPGVVDQLLEIISREANIDRALLVPDATMETLNIASIDMVSILFEIEDRFDVYLPMGEEMAETVYLYDLIKVFAEQMKADDLKGVKAG